MITERIDTTLWEYEMHWIDATARGDISKEQCESMQKRQKKRHEKREKELMCMRLFAEEREDIA